MADILPPAPIDAPFASYNWVDWYKKVRDAINSGANTPPHNTLTGLQGGGGGDYFHLSSTEYASVLSVLSGEWTYLKLGSDVTVSSATLTEIPGLQFVADINSTYVVEGFLLVESADVTTGVKIGCKFPLNLTNGAAAFSSTNGLTSNSYRNITYSSISGGTSGTDYPEANKSYPAQFQSTFITNSVSSGDRSFKVLGATE